MTNSGQCFRQLKILRCVQIDNGEWRGLGPYNLTCTGFLAGQAASNSDTSFEHKTLRARRDISSIRSTNGSTKVPGPGCRGVYRRWVQIDLITNILVDDGTLHRYCPYRPIEAIYGFLHHSVSPQTRAGTAFHDTRSQCGLW